MPYSLTLFRRSLSGPRCRYRAKKCGNHSWSPPASAGYVRHDDASRRYARGAERTGGHSPDTFSTARQAAPKKTFRKGRLHEKTASLCPAQLCAPPPAPARGSENTPRIRIAYFSLSGNTRLIARNIQSMIGGDLFEIRAVREYGPDFDSAVEQALEKLRTQARPSFPPAPLRLHLFHPRLSLPARRP